MLIGSLGILIVTPQAATILWMRHLGGSIEAILFFQLMITGLLIWVWVAAAAPRDLLRTGFRDHFGLVAAIGILNALISVGLTVAFTMTYAANVLLIYSLDPVWSAALGWMLLGEKLPRRTILALVGSVLALVVMFVPSIVRNGSADVAGSLVAFFTGWILAFWLTLMRYAFLKGVEVDVPSCAAFGSCLVSCLVAIASLATSKLDVLGVGRPLFFAPASIDGAIVAIVVTCFSIAPKYLASAHIGLMSLVETILSPLWVYIFFDETPPTFTVVGGVIILLVVTLHEGAAIRDSGGKTITNAADSPISSDKGEPA